MAITTDDFNKIWASTSPLTPYSFSASQYKEGWNFIGSTPPSRQMWDFLQKNNDEKMQYLFNNYLPLSGGTLTGDVFGVTPPNGDNSKKLATTAFVNAKAGNYLPLAGGTMRGAIVWSGTNVYAIKRDNGNNGVCIIGGDTDNFSGATLQLFGQTQAEYAGQFYLRASVRSDVFDTSHPSVDLVGKSDGTLTWGGKNIERVNASGTNYIRYESGLQICWGAVDTLSNGIFTVTFSSAFVNTSYAMNVTGLPASTGTGSSRMTSLSGVSSDKTTTSWKGTIVSASNTGVGTAVTYIAIGLWK